jgi:hypothetical protein
MRFVRVAIKVCLVIGVLCSVNAASAGPARCSVNNQDSTCVGTITTGWQTAPTCPTTAGWTTIVPATWIGSQYSAPQCNYQAPPSCPNGFTQTSPPVWNGSSWSAPGCAAPPPATATPQQIASACSAAIDGMLVSAGRRGRSDWNWGTFGTFTGPSSAGVANPYGSWNGQGYAIMMGGTDGPADFYYAVDQDPTASGWGGIGMCWTQPGTANVTSAGYGYLDGYTGG